MNHRHATLGSQNGLTLIELVIFIVITSIAVTSIMQALQQSAQHSAHPLAHRQALAIAQSTLDEVMATFFEPTGVSTTNRALFDDVEDYQGYNTALLSPPGLRDFNGQPVVGMEGFNVSIVVSSEALGPAGLQVPAAQAKRISVTVTQPSGQTLSLSGYAVNHVH